MMRLEGDPCDHAAKWDSGTRRSVGREIIPFWPVAGGCQGPGSKGESCSNKHAVTSDTVLQSSHRMRFCSSTIPSGSTPLTTGSSNTSSAATAVRGSPAAGRRY